MRGMIVWSAYVEAKTQVAHPTRYVQQVAQVNHYLEHPRLHPCYDHIWGSTFQHPELGDEACEPIVDESLESRINKTL